MTAAYGVRTPAACFVGLTAVIFGPTTSAYLARIKSPQAVALLLACGFLVWGSAAPSRAVLLSGDNGAANTEAPDDDPGWQHVVDRAGLTVIYLGRGWVLTAAHIGDGPVSINGRRFPRLFGSARVLRNGDSSPSDMILFRVAGDPGLPVLPLSTQTPAVGTEVVMIGRGYDRGAPIWKRPPSGEPELRGFEWAASRQKRWGRNVVGENRVELQTAGSLTRTLAMQFDPAPDDTPKALAVGGDSGGALFVKRSGVWELAGVLLASSGRSVPASFFGDVTLAGDIAPYRDQILAATAMTDVAEDPGARWLRRMRSLFGALWR